MAVQALRTAEACRYTASICVFLPLAESSPVLVCISFAGIVKAFLRLVDGLGFSPSGSLREGGAQESRMAADLIF